MILRRIVVELPQTPEDDPQKWKSDELVTVGACVWLVTAMVGWVGAGMEVVDGMHAGQSRWGGSLVGRCRSTSRARGGTPMKSDHTAF